MQTLIQSNIVNVIKLQALARRLLARLRVKERTALRDIYRMHARYFMREEMFETLSDRPLGSFRVGEHNYANGGHYNGEWLGGFRHGNGRMTWADGASYKG